MSSGTSPKASLPSHLVSPAWCPEHSDSPSPGPGLACGLGRRDSDSPVVPSSSPLCPEDLDFLRVSLDRVLQGLQRVGRTTGLTPALTRLVKAPRYHDNPPPERIR
ncbi:unnamed protein product [Protopolystoma xenopodis]|uniref:Uncharacterized protein n=1 Tax=Protopolystoma xenopodis TaxID=117903 RepID=A0A448WJ16_9PLAT|nr:unnamed protein product [Protopolystoma xenopodis]